MLLNLHNKSRTWRSERYWHIFSDVARERCPCPPLIHCSVCAYVYACMCVCVQHEENEMLHCCVPGESG